MVPLLAVAGKADLSETVVVQEYLVEHVPEGEGYLFHDAAHLPSVERPEEFAAVLSDWMARKGL
jgi:pimeloyl-ACP methyl ester carboxylesterase